MRLTSEPEKKGTSVADATLETEALAQSLLSGLEFPKKFTGFAHTLSVEPVTDGAATYYRVVANVRTRGTVLSFR